VLAGGGGLATCELEQRAGPHRIGGAAVDPQPFRRLDGAPDAVRRLVEVAELDLGPRQELEAAGAITALDRTEPLTAGAGEQLVACRAGVSAGQAGLGQIAGGRRRERVVARAFQRQLAESQGRG
jgi:hypothetical protein